MAMSNDYFGVRPISKRKRDFNDDEDQDDHREWKRSTLSQLPIRTSPSLSQNNNQLRPAPWISQPLTPVDSSDEEACGQLDNGMYHRRKTMLPVLLNSNCIIPSVTVEHDTLDEDKMDIGPALSFGHRRQLSSPNRQIHLLSAPLVSLDERAPTPMTSSFDIHGSRPMSRGRQLNRYTPLTPIMTEETYLPSPIEQDHTHSNTDPETTMHMEHTSNGFGALSVECKEDSMMEDAMQEDEPRATHNSKSQQIHDGKQAKLHMGFRADCEKCRQKVPGHYSHIIWS